MLYLPILEKKAIAKVLLDIAYADKKITESEGDFFGKMQTLLQLSTSDIKEAALMKAVTCLSLIKKLDRSTKETLFTLMATMIAIDGHVDDEEMNVLVEVCVLAEIPIPKDVFKF